MHRHLLCPWFLWLGLIMLVVAADSDGQQAKKSGQGPDRSLIGPPPSSLDALYPPKAEAPLFQIKMMELNAAMTGIAVDLMEEDADHAVANFKRFATLYRDVSALVPEWKGRFPMKPVDDLGASLSKGEPAKVMASIQKVGAVCHSCHLDNMVRVQQRFHWPEFHTITVHDPVSDSDVEYAQFMQFLNASLVGIGNDLQQGQRENSLKNFEGFRARFMALREGCMACHDTERKYYVDEEIEGMVNALGEALRSSRPDSARIQTLSMNIGRENCVKCHLVHMPAALAKARWAPGKK